MGAPPTCQDVRACGQLCAHAARGCTLVPLGIFFPRSGWVTATINRRPTSRFSRFPRDRSSPAHEAPCVWCILIGRCMCLAVWGLARWGCDAGFCLRGFQNARMPRRVSKRSLVGVSPGPQRVRTSPKSAQNATGNFFQREIFQNCQNVRLRAGGFFIVRRGPG